MSIEEQEILQFYREGSSLAQLSEVYGHSKYMLKKFLANEPAIQPVGYIWRSLYPSIIVTQPDRPPTRVLVGMSDGIHPPSYNVGSKNLNLNV